MTEKTDEETIKKIQDAYIKGAKPEEISKDTGVAISTVYKYLSEIPLKTTTPQVAQPIEQPQKATVIETKTLTPVPENISPEQLEADEWLRQFLEGYHLRDPFIQIQCSRTKRRTQLPTPGDLMIDLREPGSGVEKNQFMIREIVEDYDFSVEEYLKRREQIMTMPPYRRRGIPISRIQPVERYRGGIPVRERDPYYDDPYYYEREYDRRAYPERQYQGIPVGPSVPVAQPYPTLDLELERYIKIQQLLGKTEEKSPVIERYENELKDTKERLLKMEEERQRELVDDLNQLRMSYQQEHQKRQDIESELRELKYQSQSKNLTEHDIKYQELKDRQELELRKLDEKSKTRDTIASAVKTGMASIGQAIFRTAQELGSEEKHEMAGTTTGHMWQAPCPYCNTQITAPLSAKQVICPGCGRQLEISEETRAQQQPVIPIRQQPPLQNTVSSPQIEVKPKEEEPELPNWVVLNCPYCKRPMRVPENARLIQCPHCNKRLEVTPKTPLPPEPIAEAGFTVEQQLPPVEQPMETYHIPEEPMEEFHTKPTEPEPKLEPVTRETKEEEVTQEEKQEIDRSLQDAKEGKIKPLEIEQPEESPKPKEYVCDFCKKPFDDKKKLEGHRLTHLRWKHKKGKKDEKKI